MRYLALLRGINVGGNTKVPMPELKVVFEGLGLGNVKTYINSGNVAFDDLQKPLRTKGNRNIETNLIERSEQAIEDRFKLSIQVMVREQRLIEGGLEKQPIRRRVRES